LREPRVAIVGAGIGGLVAAIELARRGLAVTVFERAGAPGGKLRALAIGDARIDSGPTVFTMRGVFDELFEGAGSSFEAEVAPEPLEVLARHAWTGGARLDLFADLERTIDAVGDFAGAREAEAYRGFAHRARAIHATLDATFMRQSRPSLPGLVRRIGPHRMGALAGISPFVTLWRALGTHFRDERLRQLFGRYATYCGSSPFEAPATLMLVAHVEREGVWALPGGMRRLVDALVRLGERHGVRFRCGEEVAEISVGRAGASGVRLRSGETVEAEAVVSNADISALGSGLFGRAAARAADATPPARRSLSACTWSLVAETDGFPLAHHNVFFSDDYAAEFAALRQGRLPPDPTVYLCAPDRSDPGRADGAPERLFLIVNAPADGDLRAYPREDIEPCETRTFRRLKRCGLNVRRRPESTVVTTPETFARLFPGTGGALYGPASHGWMASFRRPGSRSRVPRLYLTGGSTHPGPGVPMAAISGLLAASSLAADLASTRTSRPAAMPGGMSTRSATTGAPASR